MPRLFFAIRTPETFRTQLVAAQQAVSRALDLQHARYKLENLQNSHCTIRFLGNVDESLVPPLIDDVHQGIDRAAIRPFDIRLTECGSFFHRGKTRVIWAGIDSSAPLQTLREAIDRAVTGTGIPIDNSEDFHPHLTLVRLKEPIHLPQDFPFPALGSISETVSEAELVESKTLATGAVHEVRAIFALK